ncbi:hypothetical protein ACQ9BO_15215 [Flavobacterium sp. P21]|uniref:hypothetical protein n=1 Tax=Flavobacterium sp. P21 TaxID=3423948 RepID=UPI003D66EB5E
MLHLKYFYKIFILIVLLFAYAAKAQQHHMMSANSKNVYLSIMHNMIIEMDKYEITNGNNTVRGRIAVRSIGLADLIEQYFGSLEPKRAYVFALTKSSSLP